MIGKTDLSAEFEKPSYYEIGSVMMNRAITKSIDLRPRPSCAKNAKRSNPLPKFVAAVISSLHRKSLCFKQ